MTDSSIALRPSVEIEDWLVQRFAQLADVPNDEIELERPFADYRLDSAVAVTVARELAVWLGRELPITVFWEYPTIASLARALETPDKPH
jgi:acyl carrier protein